MIAGPPILTGAGRAVQGSHPHFPHLDRGWPGLRDLRQGENAGSADLLQRNSPGRWKNGKTRRVTRRKKRGARIRELFSATPGRESSIRVAFTLLPAHESNLDRQI